MQDKKKIGIGIIGIIVITAIVGVSVSGGGEKTEAEAARFEMKVDGKILHYEETRTWSEGQYQNLKENQLGFKSSQVSQFNETYGVDADNFKVEFLEENHLTVFKCDIKDKISESGGKCTATFLWFLNPQGLDFIEDDFDESKARLSWSGETNGTQTVIAINLPPQDSVYEDWGEPVGHCHGHIWWSIQG